MTGVARTTTQAPTVSGGRPPGGGWHPRMRGREPGGEQRDHHPRRRWPRNKQVGLVRALGGGRQPLAGSKEPGRRCQASKAEDGEVWRRRPSRAPALTP